MSVIIVARVTMIHGYSGADPPRITSADDGTDYLPFPFQRQAPETPESPGLSAAPETPGSSAAPEVPPFQIANSWKKVFQRTK